MTFRLIRLAAFLFTLLGTGALYAQTTQVQLLDSQGVMLGKTSVPTSQLATYTQEKKAQGITVQPITAMPPQPAVQSTTGAAAMTPQPARTVTPVQNNPAASSPVLR